jgi:pseudouridine synthase
VQKLLAAAGVASRRESEKLIRQGRVTVNGRMVELGFRADPEHDTIKVDGKRVELRKPGLYLLLNKPAGVMTTRSDPQGRKTVFDLVPPGLRRGLKAVGRLDYNTEGLLLLTDDGDFAQRIAHPRYGCVKTYEVKVRGTPDAEHLAKLRGGLVVAGRKTRPVRISALGQRRGRRALAGNSWWRVELREGRTRQVREMFFRIGFPVQRLLRVGIGGLTDPDLPRGGWREITAREKELLLGRSVPPRGRS